MDKVVRVSNVVKSISWWLINESIDGYPVEKKEINKLVSGCCEDVWNEERMAIKWNRRII